MTSPRTESAHGSRRGAVAAPPTIVKHPGCPAWGLGFLVEERDGKLVNVNFQTFPMVKDPWKEWNPE